MIKDILIYPDKKINIIAPDLRSFDDELKSVIKDLKDTIEANNLQALAAGQIGTPIAVIVVKQDDGSYLEIVNPRIIKKEGFVSSTESTPYFPDKEYTVKRFKKIKLIYQDPKGEQHSLSADGDFAILLQRKIDYVFGGTLTSRLDLKTRQKVEYDLESEGFGGACPTVFKRDYVMSMLQKVLFFIFLTIFAPLLSFERGTLDSMMTFDKYATGVAIVLLIAYFYVAYGESKKYGRCSSCQMGNIVSNTLLYSALTAIISTAAYFSLN